MENVTRVEFVHYDPWRGFIVRGLTGRFACQALSDHLQPQYLFFRLEVEGQHESATAGDKPESTARKSLTTVYIAAITCFIVLFLVVVTIIVGCKMLKRKKYDHEEVEKFLSQSQGDYNPELPIDEQTGCVPYDPKWEFPEERLRMGMILGQGAFGRVVKAEAVGIGGSNDVITVAVKVVKDCTNKEQMMALVSELKILIHIGHHLNIVNLLGAVTKDLRYGKLSIIVEYCPFGCLQNYLLKNKNSLRDIPDIKLIKNKPKPQETKRYGPVSRGSPRANYVNQGMEPAGPPLTITNLLCWAFQVCRGMEYLASRKYVHRDLAARNVLLTANNVVKICDFGLARDVYRNAKYYKKREGPVPIKWMALESLTHGLYTTKSDVWSFGIFLWELFSLGGNPYPGVDTATSDFLDLLECGYRMATPKLAPAELYAVMRQTWHADPLQRPSFSQLVPVMAAFLETSATQHYLNLSSPGSLNLPGLGIQEKDGYLRMSSLSQYVPMSPTSTCPPANLLTDSTADSEEDNGQCSLHELRRTDEGEGCRTWRQSAKMATVLTR
ncbi:vascular endothelial growth factor receptor 3-like [Pomacea canaliculata]|uniref:vascular endothelial growth factor receptor 3-like n=1 Tax=Pomacea canaliculata TaxID=400727 RepID=UPI000D726AFB|nr:vascular endothelial growth factor receptor 3-like [Pomacea canaliculata]